MQSTIEANKQEMKSNKQDSDEKMTEFVKDLNEMLAAITDQSNIFKSSPIREDSLKPPDPNNLVPTKRKTPPLDCGQYTKSGGMWTLKHEISSPRFYELLINTELKTTLLWTSRTSTTT